MRKTITIKRAEKRGQQILLVGDEPPFSLEGAIPKRYMLTDSDHLSFIYILEAVDEFIYVFIPQKFWGEMKEVLAQSLNVFLQAGATELELIGFKEELAYLIENIEGNANYGEEMEKAVKDTFLT
ncbi:hypothetical protein HNQ34_002644 [Anoxybacillus tepidamans]|uniref:UPF0738 protein HNQ34_002644 n=1 Tax=Anoxybacteroides tepidamans TaxID=265948 RepID=A0A7W8MW31_9BACL|nr:hypothetical protein [Anoxybacillus tepidamans]MBB5325543.1 hypothetical protein [Anoxybacillus tepidamans]